MKKIKLLFSLVSLLLGSTILSQETIPLAVKSVSEITDGGVDTNRHRYALSGPRRVITVSIGANTYALITGYDDDTLQIFNINDPKSPFWVSTVTDKNDTNNSPFTKLDGAIGIATVKFENKTYVLVTTHEDDGVQIIDISNPASPVAVIGLTDGEGGFTKLKGARGITIIEIEDKIYALVTAHDESGMQIIDITDPTSPSPVIVSEEDSPIFMNSSDVTTVKIGEDTYALVLFSHPPKNTFNSS